MLKAQKEDILGGGKGFLKIGDIIILTHENRVYDQLRGVGNPTAMVGIDPNDPDAKEIQEKLEILAEQVAAKDNLKTRITSSPDLIYKGVMFCKLRFAYH
jgi:hypothetical protein